MFNKIVASTFSVTQYVRFFFKLRFQNSWTNRKEFWVLNLPVFWLVTIPTELSQLPPDVNSKFVIAGFENIPDEDCSRLAYVGLLICYL